jgi:hypothetical protein
MGSGTQELDQFIRDALSRGATKDATAQALAGAGWPEAQVRTSLDAYADVAFVVPVPKPRASLSAREAFFYLVLFSTLYVAAWNLGSLLFELIDRAFPDAVADADRLRYMYDSSLHSIRSATASVIIAFPVFLFVARYLAKDVAKNPLKRFSPVRRWLTYLTLFLASTVLICDMIALVEHVLAGELAVRFVLKVLVAAVIAGALFWYYLADLRREEREA